MRVIIKVIGSVLQVRVLRYFVLTFGMLHAMSSQALIKPHNPMIHHDNKFTELSVYQDRQVDMVMINTKDGPEIITAYADNHCDVHGQLSIVRTSITDPEEFSYLQPCISANSVNDIVLKKDSNNNLYVAYIENGSNSQIHLQWLKNGEDKFTEFPHSEQLTGRYPQHINLAINKVTNKPVIVYTAQDGHITYAEYLYVLKYDEDVEDASKSGFILYTPGQQNIDLQVNPASRPRIVSNSLGDLYIAYTRDQIGLVELDSNNKWSYINSVLNLGISRNTNYTKNDLSNAFDMVISGDMLYLAGIDRVLDNEGYGKVAVFTYNTKSNATFESYEHFYAPNSWDVKNLKLYVNATGKLYASIITQYNTFNSYFISVFGNSDGGSIVYTKYEHYTNSAQVDRLASDAVVLYSTPSDSYGYYLCKYNNNSTDTNNDVAFAYKMSFFAN